MEWSRTLFRKHTLEDEDDILSIPRQIQMYCICLGLSQANKPVILYSVHTVQCTMYTLYKPTDGNQFSSIVYTQYSWNVLSRGSNLLPSWTWVPADLGEDSSPPVLQRGGRGPQAECAIHSPPQGFLALVGLGIAPPMAGQCCCGQSPSNIGHSP
jgi:hypothetical protein